MTRMLIEERLSEMVRRAGQPPIDAATFVMGWRALSEWMDFCWSARSGSYGRTVTMAYGYGVECDFQANPDHVMLEVHG